MRGQTRQQWVHAVLHVEAAVRAVLALPMSSVLWLASEVTRPEGVTVAETLEAVLMARYVAMVEALLVAIGVASTVQATRRR